MQKNTADIQMTDKVMQKKCSSATQNIMKKDIPERKLDEKGKKQ